MAKFGFKKFLNLINPEPNIGGLEISDAYLKYVSLKGKKASFVSMKLPPKVIEDGRIKDKEQFYALLSRFHDQVGRKGKKIYCVASISDGNVYTEIFSLPRFADGNLEEAANLNLRMISPIDFANAYADWQAVGEKLSNGASQMEIFAVFAPRQAVDEFEEIIKKAGFDPVAVEFPALALTRTLAELGENFNKEKNYLLMRVGSNGLSFGLIKNNALYFLHFSSWSSAYGVERKVSLESFKKLVISEVQKILSFYETHWSGAIESLFLITPTLKEEIVKILRENFPKLEVKIPTLKQFDKNLDSDWFGAIGSALRGLMSRSKDIIISLASVGTEEKLKNYQIEQFIKNWRNIILAYLSAILIFFGGLDFIIMKNSAALDEKLNSISVQAELAKIVQFQKNAGDFNQKADLLYRAYGQKSKWSAFFTKILAGVDTDIVIKRIFISSATAPIFLVGESSSEQNIIKFKNILEAQPQFSNVNFQLSGIGRVGGKISFSISFNVKDLK